MTFVKLIKADLNSKKPYLIKDLQNANIDQQKYDNIIQLCNKADPTGNKAVYTQWILKQYLNGLFKGEEDIEKFKDTLDKFTKLKNSKKIDKTDINQYTFYDELAEKVDNILEESGGYTSKREEEITKTTEGIKKLDQDGDVELYLVTTPEAAAHEFRKTQWCIKDPRFFHQYAQADPNFYYFKKNGRPYILLHKNDFSRRYGGRVNEEDLHVIANLMVKNNLPLQFNLLTTKIITRKDGEIFNKIVNDAIKEGDSYYLIRHKIITRNDGELFNKMVNNAIEEGYGYELIDHRIITRKDGETFKKAFETGALGTPSGSYFLLDDGIITRKDGEIFNKAVNDAIKQGYRTHLLYGGFITKEENGELFNKLVDYEIKKGHGYELLMSKVLTKEDGRFFNRSVKNAIKRKHSTDLLKEKILTKKELQNFKKQSSLNDKCKFIRIIKV